MAIEIGSAVVSIYPSARGIEANLRKELAPISTAAALEGEKAGVALGGRLQKGLSGSLSKLGNLGGTLGVPFAGALGAVGASMDKTSTKAAGLASSLAKIGKVEAIAGAAGLAIVGKASVSAAQEFEVAQARLSIAVQNTGSTFDAQREGIEKTDEAMRQLGFTDTETEASLAKLTGATHDVVRAQNLMGLAADTARATHTDLASATQLLVNVEAGRFRGLAKLGVQTKDLTGQSNATAIAFQRLTAVVGGQGAAFVDTFEGKLAALRAQADRLEVTLGEALIPKIEALASGILSAIHGFESANSATDGFLGKAVALGAALPVAVFAAEKLGAAGGFIAGQYAKVGATLTTTTVATEAQTVADTELATAETGAATAASGLALALTAVGVGFIAGKTLGDKINDVLVRSKPNVDRLTASLVELGRTKPPNPKAFDFSKLKGDLNSQVGSDTINPIKGLQAFTGGAHQAKADIDALNEAFTQLLATSGPDAANLAFGRLQQGLIHAHGNVGRFLGDMEPFLAKLDLARAKADAAGDGIAHSGAAASAARFDYLNLASSVATAADALAALQTRAEKPLRAQIAASSARATADQAVQDFLNPDTGSGGGSAATTTATAALLEQQQKILAVTDAELAARQAILGVADAEKQLAQANRDEATAATAVRTAQETLRTTLQGVAKDSSAAKKATEDLAQAQLNAAGSKLSVRDSERRLEQAKNDRKLLDFAVKDARKKLEEDRKGTTGATTFVPGVKGSVATSSTGGPADAEQIAKDEIALRDAQIAQSGAADTVKSAELQLRQARIDARKATKDASEAQRVYNGTMDGFPRRSKEAQTAQRDLNQALRDSKDATDHAATAQLGLQTAIEQTKTAALSLDRAHADVAGKLDAVGAAASRAGGHAKTAAQRFGDLQTAALDAGDAAANAQKGLGHSLAQQLFAQIQALQTYVSAVPLLAQTFGPIIANLEAQMQRELAKHPPPGQGDLSSFTHGKAGALSFGEGGVVPGPKGKAQWAIVHGGETVVSNRQLANSVPVAATGGGMTINLTVPSLDPRTAGEYVVRALEDWSSKNGGLPRRISTRT